MEFRKIWLDILKGLGIVFVVVGHFCNIERMHDWIYSFHMPLFFFASGYLYRRKPILETIKNKFRTLMIPYFVLGMLTQLFYAINESFHAREADVGELMIGLLYGTYSSIVYNRVLWFLPTLFCITIIYSVLKISVWGGANCLLRYDYINDDLGISAYTGNGTMGDRWSGMQLFYILFLGKYDSGASMDGGN